MTHPGPLARPWGALALTLAVVFAPATAAAQEYTEEAIRTYQEGMQAFDAGDLRRAIELFRESYEVHRGHPNALYNIGQCYEQLGDLEQAINYYEQYLATDLAEGRDQVYAHIRELRSRKAVLTLRTVPAGARVSVTDANGLPLPEYGSLITPCELELPQGTFILHFEAEGRVPRTQVVDGGLGRRAVIEIALAEAAPGPGGSTAPESEIRRVFLGAYGGPAVHLNGSTDPVPSVGFGIRGGYSFFDGDWQLDVGGDFCVEPYQITYRRDDHLSWFIEVAAVPAARWRVLDQLHLLASLAVGLGSYVPPSNRDIPIPWVGNPLDDAITVVHFRPTIGLEYVPLPWLGIQLEPVAIDLDVPVPASGTPETRLLVRYDAFLALVFHL